MPSGNSLPFLLALVVISAYNSTVVKCSLRICSDGVQLAAAHSPATHHHTQYHTPTPSSCCWPPPQTVPSKPPLLYSPCSPYSPSGPPCTCPPPFACTDAKPPHTHTRPPEGPPTHTRVQAWRASCSPPTHTSPLPRLPERSPPQPRTEPSLLPSLPPLNQNTIEADATAHPRRAAHVCGRQHRF